MNSAGYWKLVAELPGGEGWGLISETSDGDKSQKDSQLEEGADCLGNSKIQSFDETNTDC